MIDLVIFKRLKVKTLDHVRNKLFFNFKKERHLWLKRKVQQHKTVNNYTFKVTSAKAPIATFSDCSRIDNLTKKDNFSKMADVVLVNPFQTDRFIYLKEEKLKLA